MSDGHTRTRTHTYTSPLHAHTQWLPFHRPSVDLFNLRSGCYNGGIKQIFLSLFSSVFISQVLLCCRLFHPFKTRARSPAKLFTTIQMWRFGRSTDRQREREREREGERVTLIAASLLWRNYLLTLTSIPPSISPPSLCLSSVAPSLLLRSNIIWVQLTSLKSPGCFKRRELEGRQMRGESTKSWGRQKGGEGDGGNERTEKERGGDREGASGGLNESQCHQRWGGERCVWPH